MAGERHAYPLVATYAHRFRSMRSALVGDAAHVALRLQHIAQQRSQAPWRHIPRQAGPEGGSPGAQAKGQDVHHGGVVHDVGRRLVAGNHAVHGQNHQRAGGHAHAAHQLGAIDDLLWHGSMLVCERLIDQADTGLVAIWRRRAGRHEQR